jgi:hypothetical protein
MSDENPEIVKVGVNAGRAVRASQFPDASVELARPVVRIFLKDKC